MRGEDGFFMAIGEIIYYNSEVRLTQSIPEGKMKRFRDLFVIVIFAGLTLYLFRNYFFKGLVPFPSNLLAGYYAPWSHYPVADYPNGPPFKPMGFDNLRIYYPLRSLAADLIRQGEPPLWNPYNFAGNTLLATYQSAIFHPLAWLFLVLPQIDAWSAIVILTPFLSGLFNYLYLRLLTTPRNSFFGAVVFALSGFMVVWWEESFMAVYSAIILPLVLYALTKLEEGVRAKWLVLLIYTLFASIVSGWFQMTLYVGIFAAAWTIYRLRSGHLPVKALPWLLAAGGVTVLISGMHLIPAAEALFQSARGSTDAWYLFDGYLLKPWQLVTMLAPDYFGNPATYTYFGPGFYYERMVWFGVIPLALAVYELVRFRDLDRTERFFAVVFPVTLSLGVAIPTTYFFLYQLKLPLLSVIIPSRIFFLTAFSGSVLSALGMARLMRERKSAPVLLTFAVLGAGFALAWGNPIMTAALGIDKAEQTAITIRNLIIPTVSFAAGILAIWLHVSFRRFSPITYAILMVITAGGAVFFANKYLYFSERRFVFPETPVFRKLTEISGNDRFWSFGEGYFIDSNFAVQFRLNSPEGYDSFFIRRYGELLDAAKHRGKAQKNIPRADVLIEQTEHIGNVMLSPYRRRLLSVLGVKYLVGRAVQPPESKEAEPDPNVLRPVWNDGTYAVWQNTESVPRANLVGNVIRADRQEDILEVLFDPSTDAGTTAVVEKYEGKLSGIGGSAEITEYSPNRVAVSSAATVSAMLVLSDAYYPGWEVTVDGKPSRIYRANYAFRAVELPAGNHTVVFRYNPISWRIGVAVTGIGLALMWGLVIMLRRGRITGKMRK